MSCLECFCRIRDDVLALQKAELDVEDLRLQVEGCSATTGTTSRGARSSDGLKAHLADESARLDRMKARLNARLDAALLILYGRSGRGGLAKAKGSAEADCACGYYLMGMTWPEVASELAPEDSSDAAQWCKRRAYRGLEYVGRVRGKRLRDS